MMKRATILICLVCGLSCGKQTLPKDTQMVFNINVIDTKAENDSWISGDKIHVFFNEIGGKYVTLAYDGKEWSLSESEAFLAADFQSAGKKVLTAMYFPVLMDISYADGKFAFTSGGKKAYNYYLHEKFQFIVDGNTIVATLTMGKKPADFALFHVKGLSADASRYTLSSPLIAPVACESIGTDGVITEDVCQAGARLSGIPGSDGTWFAGRLIRPGESADYVFTLAREHRYFTHTEKGQSYAIEHIYELPAFSDAGNDAWTPTNPFRLFVDLGLSVFWAKYNLEATEETAPGEYFSWGEIRSKKVFSWGEYRYGSADHVSKYTGTGLSVLEDLDDAAYAAFGGAFRMPTQAEWDELRTQCHWEWKGNGYLVSGKKPGFTGNSIFLPAAGERFEADLKDAGSVGYYWSSSLAPDRPQYGQGVVFQSDAVRPDSFERSLGLSVRPVMKPEEMSSRTGYGEAQDYD